MDRLATSTVGGVSTRRQYVGDQLVAEYNPATGAMTKRYIPGLGLDDVAVAYDGSGTSTRTWQLADERGSVIALSGATGAVFNINTYDEYGVPGSSNAGRFQYTGQQWLPEAGAYHYRARAYLPQAGRFLQTDPIKYAAGANLYGYVGANPINFIDPLGLEQADGAPDPSPGCTGNHLRNVETGRYVPGSFQQVCPQGIPTAISMSFGGNGFGFGDDGGGMASDVGGTGETIECLASAVDWTVHGTAIGNNARYGAGGYKSDLPGNDIAYAAALFMTLRLRAGDDRLEYGAGGMLGNLLRPGIIARSYPSGMNLRIGADLDPRIDIPRDVFDLTLPETIHFRGERRDQCKR